MAIKISPFGKTASGEDVTMYRLINEKGICADIIDFGACLVNLYVPDREGNKRDVVLGFDSVSGYENNDPAFGAVVGRNCNRIAGGKFKLSEKTYQLEQNEGKNNLHSGYNKYHQRMWSAYAKEGEFGQGISLSLISQDGDQGFPGRLSVNTSYILTNEGHLHITYCAKPDQDTIINMTNHSYFNLNGHSFGNAEGHLLEIDADNYTPINSELIPTGEIRSVKDTPFDFRVEKTIGADIEADDPDLLIGNGYDHNFVLNNHGEYGHIAKLKGEESGILMDVFTDQPGVQLYTANFLDGTIMGKHGGCYPRRSGLCLETQGFPDAPNHENFPDTTVRAGDMYMSKTTLVFSTY